MTKDFYKKAIKEKNNRDLYYEAWDGPRADEYGKVYSEADYHMQCAMKLMKEKGLSAKEAVKEFLTQIKYPFKNDFYISSLAIEIEKKIKRRI